MVWSRRMENWLLSMQCLASAALVSSAADVAEPRKSTMAELELLVVARSALRKLVCSHLDTLQVRFRLMRCLKTTSFGTTECCSMTTCCVEASNFEAFALEPVRRT